MEFGSTNLSITVRKKLNFIVMKHYYSKRLLFGYGGIGVSLIFYFGCVSALMFEEYIPATVTFFIGILLSTSRKGAGINSSKKTVFKYYNLLGIKTVGKEIPLSNYKCILVLRNRIVQTNHTIIQRSSRKEGGMTVFLANKTHTKKYEMKLLKSSEAANSFAAELISILEFPIEKYSPPVITNRRR